MFHECLNHLIKDLSEWDVSKVIKHTYFNDYGIISASNMPKFKS